ncbi:MAG: DUF5103 domain-containing protein [Bacteroidota bacterium]
MRNFVSFVCSLCVLTCTAVAQPVYDNLILDSRVKSVIFSKSNVDDRYPIITLGTDEQLTLGFDMLTNNNEFFQYTIIHCDEQWRPTPMQQTEYIRGVTFDNVNNWKFSSNTFIRYVHYDIVLPNENMRPMIAGNYVVKVYRNFDEDDLVLTRRMLVLNNAVSIEARVVPSTLAQYRFSKQEITFNVNYKGFSIIDPFNDVKVVILQNGRWDNALTGIKPQFIRDQVLEYNNFEQALFPGGNEFRFFDFRSLRQVSPNVRSKTFDSMYHVFLNYEESRGSKQYFQYIDNNGRRILGNREGVNFNLDGDYADVNFYLLSMDPVTTGEVYVFGEFTDWKLLPEYRMYYNKNRGRYDLNVLLKQGRYEYLYAIKNKGSEVPDEVYFEGSHSNTENEYLILIYHRHIQFKYDELIGVRKFVTQR